MRHEITEDAITVWLQEDIGSFNAPAIEEELQSVVGDLTDVTLDMTDVTYISSSGIRIIMRLAKRCSHFALVGVQPEVYEVLDMTGLTEMLEVHRRIRNVNIDGLKQIGAGAFGRVYRWDSERVIKVYSAEVNPLDQIEHERVVARASFVHDIPSAIPFEVVTVGDEHGIIYELIDAQTLGEAVMANPAQVDDYAERMAQLLRRLHGTHFGEGALPDARGIFHRWVDTAEKSGLYRTDTIAELRRVVDELGTADTFAHGDFHPANIMVIPDGELLLIDMGDASVGNPLIDLAGTFHVLRIAARRPGGAEHLTGMTQELLDRLWDVFIRTYYEVASGDDARVAELEHMLRVAALPRTMGSTARSKLLDDETRRVQAAELEAFFWETRSGANA